MLMTLAGKIAKMRVGKYFSFFIRYYTHDLLMRNCICCIRKAGFMAKIFYELYIFQ